MKKFELTSESIERCGKKLYRIRALKSFEDVEEGQLGGFIESENNLGEDGDAWVYDNAEVFGNARVYDDAKIYNNARVYGNARVGGNAQVSGNSKVFGNPYISEETWISGEVEVSGKAWLHGCAWVSGNARLPGYACVLRDKDYLVVGPFSKGNSITFFNTRAQSIGVSFEDFEGDIAEFIEEKACEDNEESRSYRDAAKLAKAWINPNSESYSWKEIKEATEPPEREDKDMSKKIEEIITEMSKNGSLDVKEDIRKDTFRIQGCLYYLMGRLDGGESGCDEPVYSGKEIAKLLRAVCEGVK